MDETLRLNGTTISPALFLAPMAGITHAPFRRLVADFGAYGALFTEMLSGTALLGEKLDATPFTKRRPQEGAVFYQLRLSGHEDVAAVIDRIASHGPFAIDVNLGCPAPEIRRRASGVALFRDLQRLERVLGTIRERWDGILTIKCRVGDDERTWQRDFAERLRVFERRGVDCLFVHPRFSGEKLKRTARWHYFDWIAGNTDIPVVGNGDIHGRGAVEAKAGLFERVAGVMIGRMAVVRPWIFREWSGESVVVDYREVWQRFYRYVLEDFPPEKAIGRIKEFTAYYSRNFLFGHDLFRAVQPAESLDEAFERATAFLAKEPRVTAAPSVAGI
jgi:tRNA-dihydrouridine synthase